MQELFGKVYPINALPAARLVKEGIDAITHSAELKSRAVVEYYIRVQSEAVFFFSDIAIQAEAMGATLAYGPEMMPSVVSTAKTVRVPQAKDVERMLINRDTLLALGRAFHERLLIGMVYGPFTVAGQVAGEQEALRATVEKPNDLLELLEKTLQVAQDYGRLLLDAGADVLWVSDPLAALLPPDDFKRFAGDQLARLFLVASGKGSALHICGDTGPIVTHMAQTGVSGISFDQCMNLMTVEDSVPESVAIIGNVDPVDTLELGSVEEVEGQTTELAQSMGIIPNFSLSTGCAPPPSTPVENMAAFVDAGKRALADLRNHAKPLNDLSRRIFIGRRDSVPELVRQASETGASPLTIVRSGLMRAVRKGSALYEERRCHLPSILLMVDAFYDGFEELERSLIPQDGDRGRPPHLIIGTVRGDIHEIGKNLVRLILEAHGFRVRDLGVNVPAEAFVEACKETGASNWPVIGLSAFVTSARKELKRVMDLFAKEDMNVMTILGGAAVNRRIAEELGATGYSKDAVAAVKLMERLVNR